MLNKRVDEKLNDAVNTYLLAYYQDAESYLYGNLYHSLIASIETPLLIAVLQRSQGNQISAAKQLGLSRGTLRKKMARCGLL